MADTGSEVAEGATRGTTGTIARMLERRFLWDRPGKGAKDAGDDVAIEVRCPEGELDRRAEEVLEAFERMGVSPSCAIDDVRSCLVLGVGHDDLGAAQRAIERLGASRRSGFTADDVRGLDLIEEATGRRTLGRSATDEGTASGAQEPAVTVGAEPVESSTLTFANHPEEPGIDAGHAEAYARGMRELGFDAEARTVASVRRGGDGTMERAERHIVGVSYLASAREEFALASAVTLHGTGALADLGADDPYAGDEESYERDRDRLASGSRERRDAYGRDRGPTADEYGRLPAREGRARAHPQGGVRQPDRKRRRLRAAGGRVGPQRDEGALAQPPEHRGEGGLTWRGGKAGGSGSSRGCWRARPRRSTSACAGACSRRPTVTSRRASRSPSPPTWRSTSSRGRSRPPWARCRCSAASRSSAACGGPTSGSSTRARTCAAATSTARPAGVPCARARPTATCATRTTTWCSPRTWASPYVPTRTSGAR